ncbi:MAG: DUF5615 family PIN-like protein [Oceanicaulis sp.]
MRVFADECVGMRIVRALGEAGQEVLEPEHGARDAPDTGVLSAARGGKAILLTEDSDFGALLFRDGLSAVGVFYVRCDDPDICVRAVLDNPGAAAGSIVVVSARGVRVRPLERGPF